MQPESSSSAVAGKCGMAQQYIVRYGRMRVLGEFRSLTDLEHARGEQVVIRTERGTELGEVLCPVSERTTAYMAGASRGEILRRGDARRS